MKLIAVITAAIILSSCSSCRTPVVSPITIPAAPIFPSIKKEALSCLDQEDFTRLVERKAKCETHIEVLEAVIKAHNGEQKQ